MSISSAYRRQHSTTRAEPVSGYRLSTTPTRLRAPLASIHNVRREINTSTTTPKTQYSANAWKPKSEATWLDAPLEKTVRKKTKKTTTTTTRQALPPLKLPLRRISPGAAATAAAAAEEDESNIATRKHASASAAQQRARAAAAQRITRLEAEVEHFKTTLKVVTQKSVKLEADLEASRTLHARASMAAGARYAALAHACRAEAEAAEANAATDAATAALMPVRTYVSSPRLQPIDSTAEADAESPSGVLTLRAPTPTPTPTPRRTLVAIKVGPGPLGAEIGTLLLKSASRVVVEIVSVLPDSQLARLGAREGDWVEWIGTRRLDLQGIFDPDGDGKVTESELAGALATIRTTFGVEQRDFNEDAPIENARQVAKRMMKRFDVDENGTLEPAELLELLNEVVLKRLVALLATERPLALRLSRCAIVD